MRFQVTEIAQPNTDHCCHSEGKERRLRLHVSLLSTEDALNFWKGIADVGLLGEVVTNINTELVQLLNGVLQRREQAALQDTGKEPS